MNAWASTHPRWLDRIAYVQASNHFNAHTKQSPETSEHVLKTCNDGQALLQAYHAPSEGPISLERSSLELPHDRAKERYRDLVFVSSWREGDVLTCMEHQAARDYKQDLSVVESS